MTDSNTTIHNLIRNLGPVDETKWPVPAYSGTTGGNWGYGWDHSRVITSLNVRHVLQCFGLRDIYFTDEPSRDSGYERGGMPPGYFPFGYWPMALDASHFVTSPMLAIADSGTNHMLTVHGGAQMPASVAARHLLRFMGAAHAGMLRKPDDGQVVGYAFDERSASYFLRTLVQFGKRGLLSKDDIDTMREYIDGPLLSWYEKRGHQEGGGGKSAEGGDCRQTMNGINYFGPALYDYILASPPSDARRRWLAVLDIICLKAITLQNLHPGRALQTERVACWAGLTPEGVTLTPGYGPWALRLWRVVAKHKGLPGMAVAADEEAARHDGKLAAWNVDAVGGLM